MLYCFCTDGFTALGISHTSSLHWWGQTCYLRPFCAKTATISSHQLISGTEAWPEAGNASCAVVRSTVLAISYYIITSGRAMAMPKGKKNKIRSTDLFVPNTPIWRRHIVYSKRNNRSNKEKPVTLCKCYANAFAGKHRKLVWVCSKDSTHRLYTADGSCQRTILFCRKRLICSPLNMRACTRGPVLLLLAGM